MGNCPSADDGHGQSERMIGGTTTRRDSWAAAFQAGGCHQMMLDELLLGERKFLTNMQVMSVYVFMLQGRSVCWLVLRVRGEQAGKEVGVALMFVLLSTV